MKSLCFSCILLKLTRLSKLPLNQNLIVAYHKFNNDFKSYINFKRLSKKDMNFPSNITLLLKENNRQMKLEDCAMRKIEVN
jgi:hypothetical protein